MLYKRNEIIAVAIVYEGHLPPGYELDARDLAGEVITVAQVSGMNAGWILSPHAAVRAQRANEAAYWAGSYQPADDLPKLLRECEREIRDRIIANGERPGPTQLKTIQFKGWSSVASTCWVSIHIKQ